ncbi:MAG: hypothetical protein Q9M40_08035 [Sulfurimonas sp.]|nr:hypothetical protein [Sulfurimonas sp.]
MSISFNPETQILTYENLTKQYIQINSINLYYQNGVYDIASSQTTNFSTELSPESKVNLNVSYQLSKVNESSYKHTTKKKALAEKIKFGFAIKYTVGDSTRNKTLYKRDTTNLYALIKDK